jgi:hypothetical protein
LVEIKETCPARRQTESEIKKTWSERREADGEGRESRHEINGWC